MRLTVGEILKVTGGTLLQGSANALLERISIDSRVIGENCLFVPIIGENTDGHRYLSKAFENGAKAALSMIVPADGSVPDNAALILVRDTVTALQAVGKEARSRLSFPAVGVTGSVGKTTTREMVYRALSGGLRTFKTEKNYNNRLGVPLTLSEMNDSYEIAVLELGLNVPGELGTISALTNIDTAVITNIGVAHMEYYGNQEGIAREKFTVTQGFSSENPRPKRLFLNGDDPFLKEYRRFTEYPATLFGFGPENEYTAKNIRSENGNYVFALVRQGEPLIPVTLSALGQHNIGNALAALAVADYYGVSLEKAAASLSEFTGFKGRLEKKTFRSALMIDDTYNASPQSMIAGLQVLSEVSFGENGRRIAVLGDMLELGEEAGRFHYEVGKELAKRPIDCVYLLGPNARLIGQAVKDCGGTMSVSCFDDSNALLEALKQEIRPGDTAYFKASRVTGLDKVTEGLLSNE